MNILPTELFAALAHETRLRCLLLVLEHGELCVCEVTHALELAQPHISRHLGHLKTLGVLQDRRNGLWVYYRVSPSLPDWAARIVQATAHESRDQEPFVSDRQRLAGMPERPGANRCA